VDRAANTPAMFVSNLDGNILSWSAECEALTGYCAADAVQMSLGRLLHPVHTAHPAMPPGEAWCGQFYLASSSGQHHLVDLRTTRCGSTSGAVLVCSMQARQDQPSSDAAELTMETLIEGLPCLFYVIDPEARLLLWNARLVDAVELDESEMAGIEVASFFDPAERASSAANIAAAFRFGHAMHEATIVGRKGRRTPYLFQCAHMQIHGRSCIFGTGLDISDRSEAEARLRVTERAMDACVNAIVITRCEDEANLIEYVNPAYTRITGYSREEAIGQDPGFMRAGTLDLPERERITEAIVNRRSLSTVLRNMRKNGEIFWNNLRIDPVAGSDGKVTHFVGVIDDITEARKHEEELRHLATHDSMTGLANRAALHDSLQAAIERAMRDASCLAVVYLDLDNFKGINDSFGHAAGDEYLRAMALRLQHAVRAGDTVARLGGDEFVAVINHCQGPDHVGELVGRIHRSAVEELTVAGAALVPGVSIGVSLFPHDGADSDAMLRAADAAMYRAKSTGKNQFKFYSADIDQTVHKHLERELALRHAIERNELFLGYQPKVALDTGRMVGAEALVRWKHPDGQIIMPDQFISFAEECGLIVPLGEWVLGHACQTVHAIHAAGFPGFTMSVNLSVRQLRHPNFIGTVARVLAACQVCQGALELEVTESQLMDNPAQTVRTLEQLKTLGLQLSIDDFGTGYSSLSHLQKFPVDYIKIDRSFLGDIERNGNSVITRAIISLGHSLKLKVIAEGVETREQLAFLREHGCDQVQGFYFSSAVTEPALMTLLTSGVTLQ
jgi:diguanylate cyclase (GGDEF)-like protein/PAS domain S-box-containing protein